MDVELVELELVELELKLELELELGSENGARAGEWI